MGIPDNFIYLLFASKFANNFLYFFTPFIISIDYFIKQNIYYTTYNKEIYGL